VRDVAELLERGQLNRKIGETMMNADSSRSHSVFTCILECKTTDESGITHLLSSRLNLVDLAGATHTRNKHPGFGPALCVSHHSVQLNLS
jgi:kinesin family protein 15